MLSLFSVQVHPPMSPSPSVEQTDSSVTRFDEPDVLRLVSPPYPPHAIAFSLHHLCHNMPTLETHGLSSLYAQLQYPLKIL